MSYMQGGDTKSSLPVETSPRRISGQSIARRKMTKVERAFLATDIIEGRLRLDDVPITQLSRLLNVSAAYIHHALNVSAEERAAIEYGMRPLKLPQTKALPAPAPSLVAQWDPAAPDDQRSFARERGLVVVAAKPFPWSERPAA
jgi:hypothetical protein